MRRPLRLSPRTGLILAGSLAVAVLVLAWPSGPTEVDMTHYRALRAGMTRAEVRRLVGGAPGNRVGGGCIVWVPRADGRQVSATVRPGSVEVDCFPGSIPPGGCQEVWITRTGLIAVGFGPDDRARSKYFSDVHAIDPPSGPDWLASRPGAIRRSIGL